MISGDLGKGLRKTHHVLWSADVARGTLSRLQDTTHSEINEDDVSAVREEDVLHLEVAVDDVLAMEVVERDHDLRELGMEGAGKRYVVLRHGLRESVVGLLLHQREEIALRIIVGHEVEVQRVLEAEPQFHDEGTIDPLSLTPLPPRLLREARARGSSG